LSATALLATGVYAGCPFGFDQGGVAPSVPEHNPYTTARIAPKGYLEAVAKIDFNDVKDDLKKLFVESKDFWPADYGNYGPFIIRLTWHAAGSYRIRDGRGGADGGRMRFDPERSWADNTNLDKARTLLEPIKHKYGLGLSWGDLFVLAGDAAIESMGGPTVGFCAGRIDDSTGFWSERLGPNEMQEKNEPCPEGNRCELQGAVEVGLIYVNPEGPMIDGERKVDPVLSAHDVRETFRRMGMNDTETVALVGGGHAFGKMHGACPGGPGESPAENPENPWAGNCGTGVGVDTFTSGFEGPWTSNPTQWDNEYFKNLFDYDWEQVTSPGGPQQWMATNEFRKKAPQVDLSSEVEIVMNTADLALKYDPQYKPISKRFMKDQAYLDEQFAEAWYKLMTRDMGPVTRCLGNLVPEPRPFQNPLPNPPKKMVEFKEVKKVLKAMIRERMPKGTDVAEKFARLAWRCAATHRVTDYTGGCNGARIRLAPQKDWPVNAGLDVALRALERVQQKFNGRVSIADLIVLAGNTALELNGAPKLPFCAGRTDATEDGDAGVMPPRLGDNSDLDDLRESALLLGVSPREWTALQAYRVMATDDQSGSSYFKRLLFSDWERVEVELGGKTKTLYKSKNSRRLRTIERAEYLLTIEPEFRAAAQDFATEPQVLAQEFAAAWTKIMNADRYDGPAGNLCTPYSPESKPQSTGKCMNIRKEKRCIREDGCAWTGKRCVQEKRRLSFTERLASVFGFN